MITEIKGCGLPLEAKYEGYYLLHQQRNCKPVFRSEECRGKHCPALYSHLENRKGCDPLGNQEWFLGRLMGEENKNEIAV